MFNRIKRNKIVDRTVFVRKDENYTEGLIIMIQYTDGKFIEEKCGLNQDIVSFKFKSNKDEYDYICDALRRVNCNLI